MSETNWSLFNGPEHRAVRADLPQRQLAVPGRPGPGLGRGAHADPDRVHLHHAGPAGDRLLLPPAGGMTPEDDAWTHDPRTPPTRPRTSRPVTTTSTRRCPQATRPDEAPPPEPPEEARELVFELRDLEVRYSGHTAVREVELDIAANEITAFIGPSGCGKTTVLRCLNRMHDITPGAQVLGRVTYHGEDLYGAEGRCRRGAPAHRHGVPEAEPVPEDDLRQRRVRPEDQRAQAVGDGRHRRAGAHARRAVGRGEGQAEAQRAVALRWSAAAPLHRARSRSSPTSC